MNQKEYKMNIVANTCIGAYITRDILKEKYQNPFQWNIIDYDSLYLLVEHWNDLKKYQVTCKILDKNDFPSIILDDRIKIDFVHIKKTSCINKTDKNQNNVFIEDNKIIDYTLTKFHERMNRINEEPTFIIQYQPNHPITGNTTKLLNLYNNVKTSYPIIILTNNKNMISKNNILVLHINGKLDIPKEMAHLLGNIMKKYN